MRYYRLVIGVFTACVLSSCAMTPRETRDNSALIAIQDELAQLKAENESRNTAPPAQVDDALLPSLNSIAESDAAAEDRFDVAVNEVSAKSFFMGLVKGTEFNMVVHPGVEGAISLDLQNVTISEVMGIVNEAYGYPYKKQGNLYQILPGGLRSEIFQIDYLSLKRTGTSETQVTSGEVSSTAGSSQRETRNSSSESTNQTGSTSGGGGSVGARIITETDADFWGEIQQTLKVLVGTEEGRRVIVTPQAGIIIVRAMPAEIDAAREFLNRAEVIMRRQVVLEAKILEVELNDGYQTGIQWESMGGTLNGNTLDFGVSGSSPVSSNSVGGAFSAVYESVGDFSGVIELLETQGSVQVLSSPRISTVNNQKAVIKVGTDEFFVTEISNSTTTSTGATTSNPEIELTPFFSGIALDVTPQISDNDEIILHIHPSISEVRDQTKVITLGDQTVEVPLALSTIRETDSIVFARSGQVVVLGGLMQTKSVDINSGTPVLGNLPGVGHLFSQQRNKTVKNELVILLRPVIMGPSGLPDSLDTSRARFDEFRRVLDNSYMADDAAPDI